MELLSENQNEYLISRRRFKDIGKGMAAAFALMCAVMLIFELIDPLNIVLNTDRSAESELCEELIFDLPQGGKAFLGEAVISVNSEPVSAEAAFVCTEGGRVLYAKNSSRRLPMASITKVMTAIAVIENTSELDKKMTVDSKAQGIEGSSAYLLGGDTVSVADLLYALMLSSANDAAVALAIEVSGTVEAFVELMNRKASELEMDDTVFKNPHGLNCEGHYTTAKDYAMLMSYAIKNPVFREIIGTSGKIIDVNGVTRSVFNHNRLLYSCEGMIGGKTGYTVASGRTLVTAAERNGITLICVTLNAPDDWNDHRRLYDRGFSLLKAVRYHADEWEAELHCVGGDRGNTVKVIPRCDVTVICEKEQSAEAVLEYRRFVYAPVLSGDALGELRIRLDGEDIGSVELVSKSEVNAETENNRGIISKLKGFIKAS